MILVYTLLIMGFIFVTLGWKLVPHGHIAIIEKLGIYHEELKPGIHFKTPFIYQVRAIINVGIQEKVLEKISFVTRDEKNLELQASIKFKIEIPKLYNYSKTKPFELINTEIEIVLENEILKTNSEDIGLVIENYNNLVLEEISEKLVAVGIKLETVRLKKII